TWRLSVTRVDADGVLATTSSDFPALPELQRGGLAGGALLAPWSTATARGVARSTDGGAPWTASPLPDDALTDLPGCGLVTLADGRGAWLCVDRPGPNVQRALYWLTDDGAAWSEPTPVRPGGGAWQHPIGGVALPDGDLFVVL